MMHYRYLAGGAGFIGSHVVERLLTPNTEVIVLAIFSSGSERIFEDLNLRMAVNYEHESISYCSNL